MSAEYAGEPGKAQMGHQNWKYIPKDHFKTIQWRKSRWCVLGHQITFENNFKEAIEAVSGKSFGSYLLSDELRQTIYKGEVWPQEVIPGITKRKNTYTPISIIFGRMEYYYDWSF
jgi:hypothetical protein